jgi:hypothetical protein
VNDKCLSVTNGAAASPRGLNMADRGAMKLGFRKTRADAFPVDLIDVFRDLLHCDWCAFKSHEAVLADDRTIEELERNHLAGVLYSLLAAAARLDLLPEQCLRRGKDFYLRQWLRSERLLLELGDLIVALARREQPVMILKGAYLAQRYYGASDRRASEDIDLLVRPDRLSEACSIVVACGFEPRFRTPFGLAMIRRFAHHLAFVRRGISVELHHALRVHPGFRIDYDAVWSRSVPFEAKGRTCRAPADEHNLLIQLLSMHHDLGRGVVRMRSFVDLLAMLCTLRSGFDWGGFFAERRRDGTLRLSVSLLAFCLVLFQCRSRYEELCGLLRTYSSGIPAPENRQACLRFLDETRRLGFQLWWARLCEYPLPLTLVWWLLGYPVRRTAMPR